MDLETLRSLGANLRAQIHRVLRCAFGKKRMIDIRRAPQLDSRTSMTRAPGTSGLQRMTGKPALQLRRTFAAQRWNQAGLARSRHRSTGKHLQNRHHLRPAKRASNCGPSAAHSVRGSLPAEPSVSCNAARRHRGTRRA